MTMKNLKKASSSSAMPGVKVLRALTVKHV